METWNLFTGNDIILGLIGAVGFVSAIIVLSTASGRVNRREVGLRTYLDMKAAEEAEKEALNNPETTTTNQ